MRDDHRTNRGAFPALLPGAMFILPLAFACQSLAQGSSTPAKPVTRTASAAPKPAAKAGGGSPIASLPQPPISSPTQSGSKEVFNVQFQDTDIAQALQMLSIQGQRNIITGKNVSGSVTANLFDVTVTEALDVILRALDLRYEEVGNFIYVYTRDEWEQMQQARRKRESRRYILDNISAKDANDFVSPLLSDTGKIAFIGTVDKGITPDDTAVGEDSWASQALIVVNDYPENLQAIADLLSEVDTPPTQVAVESTIVSTKVTEDNAFGIDFTILADVDFTDFVNPLGVVNNLIQGNNDPGAKGTDKVGFQPADNKALGVSSTVGRTGQPGGLKVGVISDNVSVFLRVLDEVTDAMILARPRVMALNRQRAQILVGERVGYLSTTATQTTTTQTVQFLDTGIELVFRPFIARDGSIRMELAPSVSEAVLRQVTSDSGGGVVIPDEKTNQVTTNVRVKDGQTLVIGGLYQEHTTIGRRQVPGLGDIPLIGAAFRGQDDKMDRNEIIFLITPTIMKDSIAMEWGKQALEMAEAARIGARDGMLPFSRERLTVAQNQKALDAMEKGDNELALHHLSCSLRLEAMQPEVIRMQQELDEKTPTRVFERDMMERIINQRSYEIEQNPNQSAAPVPTLDPMAQPPKAETEAAHEPAPAKAHEPGYVSGHQADDSAKVMERMSGADESKEPIWSPRAPESEEECDDTNVVIFNGPPETAPMETAGAMPSAEVASLGDMVQANAPMAADLPVVTAPQLSSHQYYQIFAQNYFFRAWAKLFMSHEANSEDSTYVEATDQPTNPEK